jgi:hypothetical protein
VTVILPMICCRKRITGFSGRACPTKATRTAAIICFAYAANLVHDTHRNRVHHMEFPD